MKFILQSCFILLLLAGHGKIDAQNRKVLVEHFTNTRCPICTSNNPGFYSRYAKYKDNAIHIAIHPSVPYNTCALYLANVQGNSSRENTYDIFGTPTVFIDGKPASSNLPSEADYTKAIGKPAEFELHFLTAEPNEVNMEIKTLNNLSSGTSVKLFVALTEKDLAYNAPNGEKHHYDVFRKFLNDTNNGIVISFPGGSQAGDVVSYSFGAINYPVGSYTDYNLISFIQSNTNTDILQAEISEIGVGAGTNLIDINKIQLNTYPNPVSDQLNIDWKSNEFKPTQIEIYNESGQLVSKLPVQTSKNKTSIQVSQLGQGFYLYKLSGESSTTGYGKFIVK